MSVSNVRMTPYNHNRNVFEGGGKRRSEELEKQIQALIIEEAGYNDGNVRDELNIPQASRVILRRQQGQYFAYWTKGNPNDDEMSKIAKESCLQRIKQNGTIDLQDLEKLASIKPRAEYLIAKNQKLRTFISADSIRKNLVAQLYEITKGVVTPETTLVVIDDSIVRGVTLKDSLVKKLIKLNPKKIVIVSSAPPVFYPDCYGIDMSQIGRFVAFQAAVCLLQERGQSQMLDKVNELCQLQKDSPSSQIQNQVKNIVDEFTLEEISAKVAEIITPSDTDWKGTIQVIYQSLDGLHKAMPGFTGDWYFSGNYPTPGGFKVLNNSYLKWRNGDDSRSY